MALTGRAAAAALLGALVVLGFRTWPALVAVNVLLLAAIGADLMLAASVRRLRITRSGDTRVLLGESASATVTVLNPGRRPLRARLRAAWPPSAHARPGQAALAAAPGGQATAASTLTPDRRGDKVSPAVIVRSFGPLGLAARQGRHDVTWSVRVLPPFGSRAAPGREALPAAPARRPAPLAAARAGHRVRLAARVRHRRRRPLHRLAGGGPPG